MIFHVTMAHTADNCPAFHAEKMSEFLASADKLDELAMKLNVKVHSLLWGAPAHVAFAVLESDSLMAVGQYLNAIALTQDFEITPVLHISDVVEFGKATMAARAKK